MPLTRNERYRRLLLHSDAINAMTHDEGIAFGSGIPSISSDLRSGNVTFSFLLNWDNASGVVFEAGDSNFIKLEFTSPTVLALTVGDGDSTAGGPTEVDATSSEPVEIVVTVDVAARRAKLWIDGELRVDSTDSGGAWEAWSDDASPLVYGGASGIKYASQLSIYYGQLPDVEDAALFYNFTNSEDGWTGVNNTLTKNDAYLALTGAAGTADQQFRSPSSLTVSGADNRFIRARIRLRSGSVWDGRCFYSTGSHGFSASFQKNSAAPSVLNEWVIVEWDMANLDTGGDDWVTETITQIRLDFLNDFSSEVDVDWVSIGGDVYL